MSEIGPAVNPQGLSTSPLPNTGRLRKLLRMPIYDYHCEACGHEFEALVRTSTTEIDCPKCGAPKARKQLSVFATPSSGPRSEGPCCAMPGGMPAGGCCGGGSCHLH